MAIIENDSRFYLVRDSKTHVILARTSSYDNANDVAEALGLETVYIHFPGIKDLPEKPEDFQRIVNNNTNCYLVINMYTGNLLWALTNYNVAVEKLEGSADCVMLHPRTTFILRD